jgi:asparagine synthase (glutamine-hydrolysing)
VWEEAVADILVRTRPHAALPDTNSHSKASDRVWLEPNIRIHLCGTGESTEHNVYDGEDALCVVVGHVVGRPGAAHVNRVYRSRGLTAVAQLDGNFVVLLHDRLSVETFLVRDSVGFGNAYYWRVGDEFGISTNLLWLVRDIHEHGGPAPRLGARGLALYLAYQYVPAPDCILEGVSQLLPGAALCFRAGSQAEVKQLEWFPTLPAGMEESPKAAGSGIRAHGDRIVDLITEAAAERLAGADRVGMMMSGGIDTSTNAVILVERLGLRPTAFTAAFQERFYDESAFARSVAIHLKVEQTIVTVRPDEIEALTEMVRMFDSPNADQAAYAEYFLGRAMREHGCRHVVTGEGGDEVLGLPQSHNEDCNFNDLPDNPSELARYYLGKTYLAKAPLRRTLFASLGVAEEVAYEPLLRLYEAYQSLPSFDRVLYGQWRTWMINGVCQKDRRVFRGFGLTPVFPLMAPALMRYVAALPLSVKLAGLDDKRFLRAVVAGSLPPEIMTRQKHKLWLPVADWFRTSARDFLHDQLGSDGLSSRIFGRQLIKQLMVEHEQANADHGRVLWALLFLELWWRQVPRSS